MDEEPRWDIIKERCPLLYKESVAFDCGPGWYHLIYDLSIKIEKILQEKAKIPIILENEGNFEMFAIQIKEKYGTLRFYMSYENEEITELIREAKASSSQTCDNCGGSAKMRGTTWLEVKCDKCYQEIK